MGECEGESVQVWECAGVGVGTVYNVWYLWWLYNMSMNVNAHLTYLIYLQPEG